MKQMSRNRGEPGRQTHQVLQVSSYLYVLELEFLVSVCWNHEKYKILKCGILKKYLIQMASIKVLMLSQYTQVFCYFTSNSV